MILVFFLLFIFYALFIWKAGKVYPVLYLSLLVYYIQYIFSVYLMYNVYPELGKEMTISQERLFEYAIPALFFLFSGIFIFNRDLNIVPYLRAINPMDAARLGHLLLAVSFFFDFMSFFVPSLRSYFLFLRVKYSG